MQRIVAIFVTLLFSVLNSGLTTAEKAESSGAGQPDQQQQQAEQLIELFELVLDRHVSPPTMQQMVLDSIVEACLVSGREVPLGLAREISETAEIGGLRLILQRELEGLPVATQLPHGLDSIGVRVTPTRTQRVNAQFAANRYVGIGIALIMLDGVPQMNSVVAGGPADQVGAEDGDEIVTIDGKSTTNMKLEKVIELLRGEEGSHVNVLLRSGIKTRDVTMTRSVVPFTTVAQPVFSESGQTAGIKIERISASNVQELRKISAKLPEEIQTVVLDLRTRMGADNLHYGELLGNALVDDDRIGWVRRSDRRPREIRAEPGTLFEGRDLVVVVDNFCRGVVKWVAAALQDTGQGMVYGSTSVQSATVSEVGQLVSGEFAVSLPTAVLIRGNGDSLSQTRAGVPIIRGIDMNPVFPVAGRTSLANSAAGILKPDKLLPAIMPRRSQSTSYGLEKLLESVERVKTNTK